MLLKEKLKLNETAALKPCVTHQYLTQLHPQSIQNTLKLPHHQSTSNDSKMTKSAKEREFATQKHIEISVSRTF